MDYLVSLVKFCSFLVLHYYLYKVPSKSLLKFLREGYLSQVGLYVHFRWRPQYVQQMSTRLRNRACSFLLYHHVWHRETWAGYSLERDRRGHARLCPAQLACIQGRWSEVWEKGGEGGWVRTGEGLQHHRTSLSSSYIVCAQDLHVEEFHVMVCYT